MIQPRHCRGFTLLEVLVAFTILVMLLGALFQLFSGGLRAAEVSQQHTRAVLIAQSQLATVSADESLSEGFQSGQIEMYRWQVMVAPYESSDLPSADGRSNAPGLRPWEVTVRVSWQDRGESRSVSLSSLILGAGR